MSGLPPSVVPSPCRDVCQLDTANICVGCGRSIVEIGEWSRAGTARRLAIRAAAELRLELASKTAQGGELHYRGPR